MSGSKVVKFIYAWMACCIGIPVLIKLISSLWYADYSFTAFWIPLIYIALVVAAAPFVIGRKKPEKEIVQSVNKSTQL